MVQRFILHNDQIRDAAEPCLTAGQVGLLAGWGVFSTIRVTRGVLFAFERHFARMKRDAAVMRVPFPEDAEWVEQQLLRLIEANGTPDATMRIVIVRNTGSPWQGPVQRDYDMMALMIPLTNWGTTAKLGVVRQARHSASRFAGTKVLSWAFNLTWYEEAHLNGFDEVVLLDEHEHVSECTSANIFVANGGQVWTPPLSCGCLPGVTRELLLSDEVRVPGYSVHEKELTLADLESADGVFITSTTRDLLPVESIDGLQVKQGTSACFALRDGLRNYIDRYVSTKVGATA